MKTLQDLEAEITAERLAREAAMIGQEHRLIPAIRTLVEVLWQRPTSERRQLLGPAIIAIAWCLVPSPATAAIGILSLMTLVVAYQQSRLLARQNDKIETQNILAEAQRRASLVVEITAIFERIDVEKEKAPRCQDATARQCLSDPAPGQGQAIFVPSQATLGRVAALTQALRPYRYLVVEGAVPELCPQTTASAGLTEAYRRLQGAIANRGPRGVRDGLTPTDAQRLAVAAYAALPVDSQETGWSVLSWLADGLERLAGGRTMEEMRRNCAPASPERGQLLVALHGAGVDISAIYAAGGDFTFADIPRARLDGIRLRGVDLSFARLPGAVFSQANLDGVRFRGADLDDARFDQATLRNVNFEGARLQVYRGSGDAPLWLRPALAERNLLIGLRMYQQGANLNIAHRFCQTLRYAEPTGRGLAANLANHGLLIETVPGTRQEAILVSEFRLPTLRLTQRADGTTLEYKPISECPA